MGRKKKRDILATVEEMWFDLYEKEEATDEEKLNQQQFNRKIRILSEGVKIAGMKNKVGDEKGEEEGSEFDNPAKGDMNGNSVQKT